MWRQFGEFEFEFEVVESEIECAVVEKQLECYAGMPILCCGFLFACLLVCFLLWTLDLFRVHGISMYCNLEWCSLVLKRGQRPTIPILRITRRVMSDSTLLNVELFCVEPDSTLRY